MVYFQPQPGKEHFLRAFQGIWKTNCWVLPLLAVIFHIVRCDTSANEPDPSCLVSGVLCSFPMDDMGIRYGNHFVCADENFVDFGSIQVVLMSPGYAKHVGYTVIFFFLCCPRTLAMAPQKYIHKTSTLLS
jgi:hypothetical protein